MLKQGRIEYDEVKYMPYTASADKSRGDVVQVGIWAGVLIADVANGETVNDVVQISGIAEVNKAAVTITAGEKLYWDNDGTAVDTNADDGAATDQSGDGDFELGSAYAAAAETAETVKVILNWYSYSGTTALADLSDVGSTAFTAGKILVADGDSYEEVAVSGAITINSSGVTTLSTATKVKTLSLADFKKDNLVTELGTAGDATNLGLVAGTHGSASPTLQGSDVGGSSGSETARMLLAVPDDYTTGDLTLRFHAGMLTTVSDTSATLDVQVYKADGEAGVGSDLCETAATSINSLTLADKDFTIDGDGLSAGDILDLEITVAVTDSGNAGAMIPVIGSAQLRYTGNP